jgi:hypothetical protein
MTATLDLTTTVLPDICDEVNCRLATSHPDTCRCACQGDGHGIRAQVDRAIGAITFQARRDVTGGFTRAMVTATADEDIF